MHKLNADVRSLLRMGVQVACERGDTREEQQTHPTPEKDSCPLNPAPPLPSHPGQHPCPTLAPRSHTRCTICSFFPALIFKSFNYSLSLLCYSNEDKPIHVKISAKEATGRGINASAFTDLTWKRKRSLQPASTLHG